MTLPRATISSRLGRCLLGLAVVSVTVADRPAAAEPSADGGRYSVALNAGAAIGANEFGTELGSMGEAGLRVQALRWLDGGLSFFQVNATNNEGYLPLALRAFELATYVHPGTLPLIDPFVQLGVLRVVDVKDGYPGDIAKVSHWGAEGMVGLNVKAGPVAVGLHLRHGF